MRALCFFLVASTVSAATITSGQVSFDSRGLTPADRGWGRTIAVDLFGSGFELKGMDSDTTFAAPGTISGGFAFAPTSANLARAASSFALTYMDGTGTYTCPGGCLMAGTLSLSSAGVALPATPVPLTSYVFTTSFALNPSRIAVVALGSSPGRGTLDDVFTGGGTATITVAYRPLTGTTNPVFFVERSEFVFSATPEPVSWMLLAGGLIITMWRQQRV